MPPCTELTPYRHASLASAYAVGWLARGEPFQRGAVPSTFLATLRRLEREGPRPDAYQEPVEPCALCPDGCTAALGRTLFVRIAKGWLVASPRLAHYVEAHRYVPPMEFLLAVEALGPTAEPSHGPANIRVLGGLDPIRLRPDMYFGPRRARPTLNCVELALAPLMDLHAPGAQRARLDVRHADGRVDVTFPALELPARETIDGRVLLEVLAGQFLTPGAQWSDRLPLLNGASRRFSVTTTHRGERFRVDYLRGHLLEPTRSLGPAAEPGTTVSFELDPFLFEDQPLSAADVELRLLDLALMVPRVDVTFQGEPVTAPPSLSAALHHRCPGDALPILATPTAAPVGLALTVSPSSSVRIDTYASGVREVGGPFDDALFEGLRRAAPTAVAAQAASEHLIALVHVRASAGASPDELNAAIADAAVAVLPGPGPWWDAVLERART